MIYASAAENDPIDPVVVQIVDERKLGQNREWTFVRGTPAARPEIYPIAVLQGHIRTYQARFAATVQSGQSKTLFSPSHPGPFFVGQVV